MNTEIEQLPTDEVMAIIAEVAAEYGRRAYESLAVFVRESWLVLEPTTKLVWNWHLDAICEHVQAALEGWMENQRTGAKPPVQNLLINVPPGSMKSRIVSVCAFAWMWLHWPSWRAIFISSNPRVALRDAVYCRELITSDWYQKTFSPKWDFAEDQNAKGNYRNDAGGERKAIGVGSKLTGERGDALIIDDPHDANEVQSDVIRQGVLDWYDQTACNRVNDLNTSLRIGIGQRLHDADWSGHVLASGEWEHLCIPMEYVPGHAKLFPKMDNGEKKLIWLDVPTFIGWHDPRKEEKQLMCPVRFPKITVDSERTRLGSAGYSAQHQQDPMAAEGNEFKKEWFQHYQSEPEYYVLHSRKHGVKRLLKSKCVKRFSTVDTAFSSKETADYTVIATWDVTPENELILVDITRGHFEDPDAEREIEKVYVKLRPQYMAIEDKQNGATILQRMAKHNRVRTRALKADTDKKTRASLAIVDCENGLFYFPAVAPWLVDYEMELLKFPNGAHDDQVDVTAYAAIEKGQALSRINAWGEVSSAHQLAAAVG